MNHFFKFGEKHHALQGRFLGQIEFLQRSGDPAGRRQREIGLGVTHPRPGFGLRRRTHPFFGKRSGSGRVSGDSNPRTRDKLRKRSGRGRVSGDGNPRARNKPRTSGKPRARDNPRTRGDSPGSGNIGGGTPGNSGSTPGNSGSTPGNSGGTPGNSGGTPGNSGSTPGNSGGTPEPGTCIGGGSSSTCIDSNDSGFRPAHGLLERLRGLPNLELRGIDSPRSGEDHPVLPARNALQSPAHGVLARRGKPDGDQMPPPSVFKAFFVVLKALTCEHTANAERS